MIFKIMVFLNIEMVLLSNEQKISPPFGDKDFVPRLGIFCSNSTAIAKKNNDVLVQKIIGEMMELLFTRY